jgi:hypothetical protein
MSYPRLEQHAWRPHVRLFDGEGCSAEAQARQSLQGGHPKCPTAHNSNRLSVAFPDALRTIMPSRSWASWPFTDETQNPTRPIFDLLKTSSGMGLSMEDFDPVKAWNEALFEEMMNKGPLESIAALLPPEGQTRPGPIRSALANPLRHPGKARKGIRSIG